MPTQEQKQEVLGALVSNGLDFIERSAEELPQDPKFAIVHFATGLELLLKSRLFAEHWTLVASDPHKCSWPDMQSGELTTIAASKTCDAIAAAVGTSLATEKPIFKAVFEHRNRVLHLIPHEDVESVVAEQCNAWYRLNVLLEGQWSAHFEEHRPRIRAVESRLRGIRQYMAARFNGLAEVLAGPRAEGKLAPCPACGFNSAILDAHQLSLSPFRCLVCDSSGSLARFPCGNWLPARQLPCSCPCGAEHETEELEKVLGMVPQLPVKPGEIDDHREPHCGECLEYNSETVDAGNYYYCLLCGIRYDAAEYSRCGFCDEAWVGYDTTDSNMTGCEFCDGSIGWQMAKND